MSKASQEALEIFNRALDLAREELKYTLETQLKLQNFPNIQLDNFFVTKKDSRIASFKKNARVITGLLNTLESNLEKIQGLENKEQVKNEINILKHSASELAGDDNNEISPTQKPK